MSTLELVPELVDRRERIIAANTPRMSGAALARIAPRKAVATRQAVKAHAVYEKGRYIPPLITRLMALVAHHASVSVEAITGFSRRRTLIDARFCIANLAEEFAPRLSDRAIDDAMLRGVGCCAWYRNRHRDRLERYPSYRRLHAACRAELAK
ncbi:MAG: hypothetical protein JSR91_00330 [Proteobacteria bacterium]|nr:hypothetical protein [Pseudomonadota bacterium]